MSPHTQPAGHVLIAIDYPEDRPELIQALHTAGYRVSLCPLGEALIQELRRGRPDLLVLCTEISTNDIVPDLYRMRQEGLVDIPTVVVRPEIQEYRTLNDDLALQAAARCVAIHGAVLPSDIFGLLRYAHLFCRERRVVATPPQADSVSVRVSGANDAPAHGRARALLASALVTLIVLSALGAIVSPESMTVFERLLPVLMLIVGYFFGQKAHSAPSG